MPVKRKVYSVNIQMILSIIPVVDLWAAYRIEKLRLWVLFWIGMFIVGFLVGLIVVDYTASTIINLLISIPIAVFLMRHFTIEWNKDILFEGKDDKNEEDDSTETRYRLD